ncbi:MAG: Hsp33 family molecular chaperone HslO [Myxococcota bacterium]
MLIRALVADGAVRLLVVEATGPAAHAREVHGLGPDAARLATETIVASALASAHIKGEEQLTLQIQGTNPPCSVYADVTSGGNLRARVTPDDLTLGPDGRFSGILLVIKHTPGVEPYRGATEIDDATLERGIGVHFGSSTQVDAILRVGCVQAEDGEIRHAGGLLLERLPEESDLPSIAVDAFTERYGWLRDAELDTILTGIAFGRLGDEPIDLLDRTEIRWQCRCSIGRIEETLSSLPASELVSMIAEDHGALVTCNFCNSAYTVTEERLREILAGMDPAIG